MGDVQQPAGLQVGNGVRSRSLQHLSEITDGLPGPLRLGMDATLSNRQNATVGVGPQAAVLGLPDSQVRHPELEAEPDGQVRPQQVLDFRQQSEGGAGMLQRTLLVPQLQLFPAQVEMEPPSGYLGKEPGLLAAGLQGLQFRPQVARPEVPQHRVAIGDAFPEFLQGLHHFPVAGNSLLPGWAGTATVKGCHRIRKQRQNGASGCRKTAGPPHPAGNASPMQSPAEGGFR